MRCRLALFTPPLSGFHNRVEYRVHINAVSNAGLSPPVVTFGPKHSLRHDSSDSNIPHSTVPLPIHCHLDALHSS